jgi:iron complex outermembrane receptor protein
MVRFIVAILIAGCASLALAQNPEDAVIVTATRFPERRLDAPVGMAVINAEQISRDTARTLPELLSHLGGVNVRDNTGSPDQQLDLRGFGINGDQNTLVLLDGVRINENDLSVTKLSSIPLKSIERIEIIPGGGAVVFGGGATGGTINIITKAPSPGKTAASVFAGYGSYGSADVRAGSNYGGENLGFALNAGHQESDNYRQNNRLRQDNLIGDVRYGNSENGAGLKFGADDQHLQLPGARSETEFVNDPRGAQTPSNWSTRQGEFGTFSASRRLGTLGLAADLAYRDSDSTAYFAPSINRIKQRNVALSPRARLPFTALGIDSVLIAGFDWSDWNYDRAINFPPFPLSSTTGTQQNTGTYVQYNGRLASATKLTLGAREQRVADHRVDTSNSLDQSQTQNPHAEEIGLSQDLFERWQLYGKAGTSFRIANVDENGFTATGDLLKAQTARNREVGLEFRPGAAKLRASVYDIELDNEIYFSPIAGPFGANINLSPTRRRGAELAGQWAVAPGIDIAGSFAYQIAKFRSGVYGGIDVTNKDIPLVPRQIANVRGSWRVADKTVLRANGNFVGHQRYDNDQDNTFPRMMPAYALFDAKLTREWSGWLFSAAVNNLFDKKYFSYGLVDNFGSCGTPTCVYPQVGRTFFVSAEYAFE